MSIVLATLFAGSMALAQPVAKPPSPLCGTNAVLLCRGGLEQGAACTKDSDCPDGICTQLGHPRRCRVEAFCNVSKTVRCSDNRDCPLFPFKDPTDFCPHVVAKHDCTTDADCGPGGVCINDTLAHAGAPELPFGGVGASGMGGYHGRTSFETFSHRRAVLEKSNRFDVKVRYPPYGKSHLKWAKKLI